MSTEIPSAPTFRAIAAAAGVSAMTVSRALRDDPRQPATTNARVRAIAQTMGYRPNPLVSALLSHVRQGRVGAGGGATVVLFGFGPTRGHWRHYPTVRRMIRGAVDRAESLGFTLDEMWLNDPAVPPEELGAVLAHRGVAALLFLPMEPGTTLRLDVSRYAVASMGYTLAKPALHRATVDHYQMAGLAIRELSRAGSRRIGLCIDGGVSARVDHRWLAAYLVHSQNLPTAQRVPPLILRAARQSEKETAALRWYEKHRPDTVLTADAELRETVTRAGLRVPGDVGLAHLDRAPEWHDWSGIDQNLEEVGAAAVDLVFGQINRNVRGVPEHAKTSSVEGTWVQGTTTQA